MPENYEEHYSEEMSINRAWDKLYQAIGPGMLPHDNAIIDALRELWEDGSTYGYNWA